MKTKLTDGKIMRLLLLVVAGLLACYIFKMNAVFLVAILALWGLKIAGRYDWLCQTFGFLKRYSFKKIIIWNIALFLWFSGFFAMFFSSNSLVSNFGTVLIAVLKTLFNTAGTIVLLFLPVIFIAWKFYKNRISNRNIFASFIPPKPIPCAVGTPNYIPETAVNYPVPKPDFLENKTTIVTIPEKKLETYEKHVFPGLDLLKDYPTNNYQNVREEVENKKHTIRQCLNDFGISTTDITSTVGDTVTLYEVAVSRGVGASKIESLDKDIARYIKVPAVRIINPFKNKGTVAIEVPREKRVIAGVKSLLSSEQFKNNKFELPLALGKTIDGEAKIVDLALLPHILIGGATGQGKSVGINAMLTSLLYKKNPSQLQLVLMDPKRVELTLYKKIKNKYLASIPNVTSPVITDDINDLTITLQWLCRQMEERFVVLENNDCRDIKEYNAIQQASNKYGLPYIVVVMDEFVDLLMQNAKNKEVEESIIRLSRLARAVGIHLIIATQRPDASVISGQIRANFPARIAYRVNKFNESQIILGSSGGEKLAGNGDMLFSVNAETERLQGAFVDTEEVKNIVNFIAKQNIS
ncbi:MAG: FtsK/SpoIIIE domain-containing protein [Lentimicrobiaceae bacterium]|nr:FtsK/SpoIIIE domain-containing protein [Lentimicrobiaceae bacterium]